MIEIRKLKFQQFFFLIISAVFLFFYLKSGIITYQHIGDEQENITAGWLINKGKIPYKDFFFHHTPLPFFISAFLQKLPFDDFVIHRHFMLVLYLGVFGFLYKISGKKIKTALLFSLILILLMIKNNTTTAFLADNFAAVSVLGILVIFINYLTKKNFELKKVILSYGIFTFFSLWSSYTSVLAIGVLTLYFFTKAWKKLKKDFQKLDKKVFLVFLLHLIFPLYFLANGSFFQFFWANFIYNRNSYFPLRLAENKMELKYGVFYRIFHQFSKYIVREGENLGQALLILGKTLKNLFLKIFYFSSFFEGIKIAIQVFLEKISGIETVSFAVLLWLFYQFLKKFKWQNLFFLLFIIFLRARSSELFHLNIFYFCILFLGFYKFTKNFKKKKYFLNLLFLIFILAFFVSRINENKEIWQSKEPMLNPGILQTGKKLNKIAKNKKLLILNGDTIIYKLSNAELGSRIFYFYPWFYNCPEMRAEILTDIKTSKPEVIFCDICEKKENYFADIANEIEKRYKNMGEGMYVRRK